MMTQEKYQELYEKYLEGKCTPDELYELESYQDNLDIDTHTWQNNTMGDADQIKQFIIDKLEHSIYTHSRKRSRIISYSIAASMIFLLSAGLYYYKRTFTPVQVQTEVPRFKNDILPGNNKAVLTLDDGSVINLDDAQTGVLASESDIEIKKTGDGRLEYIRAENEATTVRFNTLRTPMGGEFQLVLPDGTKVWLNSGTSLRFPTAFTGSERVVELNGEAYFAVKKNTKMPFHVLTSNNMDVKVLGTEFNVMAYDNEKMINTTLIEGSVEVQKDSKMLKLNPGEEVVLNKVSGNMKIGEADIEQATAWKEGQFVFVNENIESIMRKVSRWYNVDVEYKGNLRNKDFVGTISRKKNVSELLKMLELTGAVHFGIEGRRITVMP